MNELIIVISSFLAALAAIGALIFSIINSLKIHKVHVQINSRMDELLSVTKSSEFAKGLKEGKEGSEKRRIE